MMATWNQAHGKSPFRKTRIDETDFYSLKENSMNYRKTTSRLIGQTKMNARLVLIAACILAVLLVLRAATPDPAHAQQNEGDQSPAGAQNPATPLATPVPYFQLTWTAVADSYNDDRQNGVGSVTRRHIVMALSTVVRKLDNIPSPLGRQDNYPVNLTVTDDLDIVSTYGPCTSANEQVAQDHHYWSIRDSGRYNPGPVEGWYVDTVDLGDGKTYILDPFQNSNSISLLFDRPFDYKNTIDSLHCDGSTTTREFPGDAFWYAIPLETPSPALLIEGDQDGNEFKVSREFTPIDDPIPVTTVKWTFSARRLLDRDLTVDRLEVNQALQDKANSIPLVKGRRTVVRAYIGVGKEQKDVDNVTGELSIYSNGALVDAVKPFNPGGRITARVSPDWLQINHTLNFEVPLAVTRMPSLRFEVEVNSDRSLFETDYSNNKLSATPAARDCTGIDIGYVPIHFTPPEGNFGYPQDPDAGIDVAQEFMRKIYPIPEKGLNYHRLPILWWRQSVPTYEAGDVLLAALGRSALSNSGSGAGHVFGWLPYGGNTIALGYSTLPGFTAWGQVASSFLGTQRLVLAHEIGHNKGLMHSEETTGGRHWFDVYERKIKNPTINQDELRGMMEPTDFGGEPHHWISPASYRFLMDKMCSGGSNPQAAAEQSPAASDNLIVTGTVKNLAVAAGTLDPMYRITTAPSQIPSAGAPYCVKLENAAGGVLNQYCFSVSFEGEGGTPAAVMPFGMSVPYPAGLSRVELTKGTTVLSSRQASANPPAVTLTFPNASGLTLSGVQDVTWTGSDPDGGTLTYSLLHSRDNGATWTGIASNIVGNSYALDFSSLPGGANSLIKVIVSDGFRSAEDVSDNAFGVANKPPTAAIVSPPTDTSFPANTKLTLQATGADLEDGSLGDAAFNWSSDRDGALGSGQILETNLSTGTHTITLTARDSGALTSTATITCNAVSTAVNVSVSGRVVAPDGRGLRNTTVFITDPSGVRRTATTSSFGFYRFDSILTGQQYAMGVSSRLYRFAPRTLTVNDDVANLDFMGLE